MKLTKIDLSPYKVQVNIQSQIMQRILTTPGVFELLRKSNSWTQNEITNLTRGKIEQKYAVKDSIINILFMLKVPAREAYEKRDPLTKKIGLCDDEVLLQKEEYAMLLKAFEEFQNPGRNEEELLKRIFEAKEVEVEEKKKGKKK